MKALFIEWFGAIVLFFFVLRAIIDLAASIDYAQEAIPLLKRFAETKKWHRILLTATCLFYGGTLYDLLTQPTEVLLAKVPTPLAPGIVIQKRIIKTTGSGRLDRDMNDQQSDHLYNKLRAYVDSPNRTREAKVTLVGAYPCDRETQHLFFRLTKVFTDAHWTVASEAGWPMKSVQLAGAQNRLPIGIWVLTDDQYLRYLIWSGLEEAGLPADDSFTGMLPDRFEGVVVVIGYKDVPM